ncbi:hypothetical protein A1O3_06902 [Capronia epimyces CBS 606.96]|uniref:Uncharacterized protein n=1 Tax=Capronia epimyces CBS 606.96 TaxID=1182542 RepID=W9XK71_9EURO|nr:uncharacterized protein A1O3_06902 [Capronia epimyces CBS 606.96]EXJ80618.1 hypothetical protein A1O3_06902 [Capronia epimyces CBS 606.96]
MSITQDESGGHPGGEAPSKISPVAGLVFVLTGLLFMILLFCIGYTYGHLVPTLCMIESPETQAYLPVDILNPTDPPAYSPEDVSKPTDDVPEDLEVEGYAARDGLLIRNKPFTSSIRQTILHLRARAGYWSRFRGLSMFIVWHVVSGFIGGGVGGATGSRLAVAFAAVVIETLLANLHMAWVHIVISEPRAKRWYHRIPSIRTWPKIAPAVALWAASSQIVAVLPGLVCGSFGSLKRMNDPAYEPGKKDLYAVGAQGFMGMFIMLALFVLLQIPATVTLVRVAASMLPEEDETIVPFDRTFDGRTTPAIIGGQGKIGLVEAWRSFPWASRARLLKLMMKVVLLMMAAWILFTTVLVAEAHIMFGDQLGGIMKGIHGVAGPH